MSETHEEARSIQIREAESAAIDRINSLYDQSCDDSDMQAAIIRKVNLCRECGFELIDLSAKQRGRFKSSFQKGEGNQLPFRFSYETAKIYMRIGRNNPEPITSLPDAVRTLKDAWIATGGLPAPQGHGPQRLHQFDFLGGVTKKLFDFKAYWGDEIGKVPVDKWDEDRRITARDEFRWFAEQYVALGGKL